MNPARQMNPALTGQRGSFDGGAWSDMGAPYSWPVAIEGLTTCLWFDDQAVEAAQFYVDTFPGSRILSTSPITVEFELFGQVFLALNGGPVYTHSPATSFQVFCETQEEIDALWAALTSDGGQELQCGWCTDRFGVSWQVIPRVLPQMLSSPDSEVSGRAMERMMPMRKIVIANLFG